VSHLRIAVNIAGYQCAWFACVLSASAQRPGIGVAVASAVVAWHLHTATEPGRELRLIGVAVLIGAAFETLLVTSNWISMEPDLLVGQVTPLWMVAVWAAFATTLNVSLRALRPHWFLAAILAAIGAPLAYYAGAQLGALQWVHQMPALIVIAFGWAAITPLLLKSAQRFDGFPTP
jgi:hypothetical protein